MRPTDPLRYDLPVPAVPRPRTYADLVAQQPGLDEALDALDLTPEQWRGVETLLLRQAQAHAIGLAGACLATARAMLAHAQPAEAPRWAAVAAHVLATDCGGCERPTPPPPPGGRPAEVARRRADGLS